MKEEYKISDWELLINTSDLTKKEKIEKLFFVKNAFKNEVPVILDLDHLSYLLGFKKGVVASMINSPKNFYKEFSIPKKRGGYRDIVTPYKSLLEVQQWILSNILSSFHIHDSAFAYVKNRNIALNAKKHIGQKEMLKIDLKDFFPTIQIPRVRELFNRVGYSKEIAGFLTQLCCLNGSIPQGAATSPMISNIILKTLDKRLYNFSKNNNIIYSRYADDLIFSGKNIPLDFELLVIMNIEDSGFKVNTLKTRRYSGLDRKLVTGIVVSEDKIRLPKKTRREIKSQVYYLKKFGILDQVNRYNDIFYIDRVLGRLSFWKQIEPENEYVLTSIEEIKNMYTNFIKKK